MTTLTPKRRVLLALLLSMFVYGLAAMLATSQPLATGLELTAIFLASFLVFAWYCEDARERRFRRGRMQDFGVAALGAIGLPIYLFRSRGALGGALATGGAIMFYLSTFLSIASGAVLGLILRLALGMPVPQ
jgi:hypothetical protein